MTADSFERFKELAAAYGADKHRWPLEDHALFEHYSAMPKAQLALAGAQQIDHFLNEWQPDVRENALIERMALPEQISFAPKASAWSLPAAIMMLCALLGFGDGYFSAEAPEIIGHGIPAAIGMEEE